MKKTYSYSIIIILLFLSYSCGSKEQKYDNADVFSYSDILSTETLKGEILAIEDIYKPMNLYVQDSILFVVNIGTPYHLTCYNTRTLRKIGDFIPFGGAPNESLSLKSLQFRESEVWAFDMQLNKFSLYPFSQFLQPGNTEVQKSIKIDDTCLDALIVKDKIFANALNYPDSRFSVYNTKGAFVENRGGLPAFGTDMTDLEKVESFFCSMALKPESDLIFVSYFQTDLIEIYDISGELKHRTHGPGHFYPVKKEESKGKNKKVNSIIGETRDAYFYPAAFTDEIWTLYSGKVFDPNNYAGYLMDKIIVFNWFGEPVKMYTLDIPIYSLAVDKLNKTIYGVAEAPDLTIVKFKY